MSALGSLHFWTVVVCGAPRAPTTATVRRYSHSPGLNTGKSTVLSAAGAAAGLTAGVSVWAATTELTHHSAGASAVSSTTAGEALEGIWRLLGAGDPRIIAESERAMHHRRMPRRGAEERIAHPGLQGAGAEPDGRALAAPHHP